jgi:hypothetical protein
LIIGCKPSSVTLIANLDHNPVRVPALRDEGKIVINSFVDSILNGFFKVFKPKDSKNPNMKRTVGILSDGVITLKSKDGRKIIFSDESANINKTEIIEVLSKDRIVKTNKITQVQSEIEKTNNLAPLHDQIIITREGNEIEFDALKEAIIQRNTIFLTELSEKMLQQVEKNKFKFKEFKPIIFNLPESERLKADNLKSVFISKDGREIILDRNAITLVSKKGKMIKIAISKDTNKELKANVVKLMEDLELKIPKIEQ